MADGISLFVGIRNALFFKGLDDMRSGAQKFKGDLSNMFAGAIGFGAITAAISKTVDYADTIADLAQRFGIGTTELQRFGQVAEQNGSSLEAVAGGLNKLAIARSKALSGNEEMIQKFRALNVTQEDLKNSSPEQLLQKIGSSSMDAATMVAVLGKSALELVPSLRALADGSAEFGDAMDENAIQKLAAVSDKIKELRNTLTVTLGTALVWVSDQWQKLTITAVTGVQEITAAATGLAKSIGFAFKGQFEDAKIAVVEIAQEIQKLDKQRTDALATLDEKPQSSRRPSADAVDGSESDKESKRREDRIQRIKDAEADAARAALEGQTKINALVAERNRLLDIYRQKGTSDEGLDAYEKAQRIAREIAAEQKKQDEDAARRDKEITDARARERDAQRDYDRDQMDSAGRVKSFQEEKAQLLDDASKLEKTDPAAAAKKRTEAIGVQKQIDAEHQKMAEEAARKTKEQADALIEGRDKEAQRRRSQAASITVDSLQQVGGGGRFATIPGAADPATRERQQQTRYQREMVQLLRQLTQAGQSNIPEPWRM